MVVQSIALSSLVDFLSKEFAVDRYPANEQGGVYRASERPIQRLGLALEPGPGLLAGVAKHQPDALWLHRPWQLDAAALPADIGVVYNHLPFDETLTIGYNRPLAAQLGALGSLEPLGYKQAANEAGEPLPQRAIGMLFDVPNQEFDPVLQKVKRLFGGYDRATLGRTPALAAWAENRTQDHPTAVRRVAVVGAMNDALVWEAADRGAQVYITGQYRKPGQEAVDETGMAVIAVGHRRSEEWGLRALAHLLRQRWPELKVVTMER